jgi:predicted RNase H-like nuclease
MKIVGIDPCLGGWLGIMISGDGWAVNVFKGIKDIITTWSDSDLFLVNLPIGLTQGTIEERSCDVEARKLLLMYNDFDLMAIPCREAIYCSSFGVANIVNKRLTGRKIPTRIWDVVDKIRELDTFLTENKDYREKFKECNCEIGYLILNGRPMINSKTTLAGYNERRNVLKKFYPNIDGILDYTIKTFRRKDLKVENVLDAVCLNLHGIIGLERGFLKLPDFLEYDEHGIRMQIEVAKCSQYNYTECVI